VIQPQPDKNDVKESGRAIVKDARERNADDASAMCGGTDRRDD
jgi:hypothetical protein